MTSSPIFFTSGIFGSKYFDLIDFVKKTKKYQPIFFSFLSSDRDFDTMRVNQLPAAAARWQHGSKICFVTFIYEKITKLLITQQPLKLENK
jgi:hypothetical protein